MKLACGAFLGLACEGWQLQNIAQLHFHTQHRIWCTWGPDSKSPVPGNHALNLHRIACKEHEPFIILKCLPVILLKVKVKVKELYLATS